mmetsp:Transcript_8791/g.13126  ORF Transcript_8791/g.13126 Transcript_8791/m.13126 type:complete len:228 (-) Transcript_8791:156-839(-)|eukprot:CAMPEP_0167747682 /NCGR_PEP_ID=MMETSP0110_2-20121227/4417_1 /TAXON_ID=629695 /ORGANISM="Gymnochlora sp., Strain CCMP2014" /LENGTH=227 /DNA_ID=CAMNT_0007632611 /DNA_START=50 /DNA_END=733 /DNA_ORIENTATION=-
MGGQSSSPPKPKERIIPPPGTPLNVNEGTFGPNQDPNIDFPKQKSDGKKNIGWYFFHPDSKESGKLYLPDERKTVSASHEIVDKFLGFTEYEVGPAIEKVFKTFNRIQKEEKVPSMSPDKLKTYDNGQVARDIVSAYEKCSKMAMDWRQIYERHTEAMNICESNGYSFELALNPESECNRTEECRRTVAREIILSSTMRAKLSGPKSQCKTMQALYQAVTSPSPEKK